MAALNFVNAHGLRALAVLGIMCSGAAVQGSPPANEKTTELLSIQVLCGASHVNSSITYITYIDAQACSQLRSTITPFNTDFTCPQIFLRHAQDHTEPPAGSPIPE